MSNHCRASWQNQDVGIWFFIRNADKVTLGIFVELKQGDLLFKSSMIRGCKGNRDVVIEGFLGFVEHQEADSLLATIGI